MLFRSLEYDDVMNSQREVVYNKRRQALFGERLAVDIANSMYDVCESIVAEYQEQKDFEGFKIELISVLSIESPVAEKDFMITPHETLVELLYDNAYKHYQEKASMITENVFPVVKNVYENSAHVYENIVIPFTDGITTMQVIANLKKSYESKGRELFNAFEKNVPLNIIDDAWKEHLRELDELKTSVQNAVYEQKDPLLIYKFESFELFKTMITKVNKEIVSFLSKAALPEENKSAVKEIKAPVRTDMSKLQISRTDDAPGASGGGGNPEAPHEKPKIQPIRVEKTVGRNDPCPCGSGKKFKNCHGANA